MSGIWNFYTGRDGKPWIEKHVSELEQVRWPKDFETYIIGKTQAVEPAARRVVSETYDSLVTTLYNFSMLR